MSLLRRRMMMASSVKEPDVPDTPTEELDYFTVVAEESIGCTFTFMPMYTYTSVSEYEEIMSLCPYYYRIDNGEWFFVESREGSWFEGDSFNVPYGSFIQFKSNINSIIDKGKIYNAVIINTHEQKGLFSVGGSYKSLIYGDNFNTGVLNENYDDLVVYFQSSDLGYSATNLKKINNPQTFLTSTILKNGYSSLFSGCYNLENSPNLPATELIEYCYYYMFEGCTSLVKAPVISATTLAEYCCSNMFEGCTSLVSIPELPATTLAKYCYNYMFRDCTNLNYIKMLATDISADGCLSGWVNDVPPTGTFVKNKDATWDTTPGALGDSGVPAGWTVVNDGEESGGGLINFTIDGTSYQAEEGMTWEEWVNSKYNTTKNYYFSDLDVLKRISDDYYIYDGEGNLSKQENIIDNFNYSAYYSGSNDDF